MLVVEAILQLTSLVSVLNHSGAVVHLQQIKCTGGEGGEGSRLDSLHEDDGDEAQNRSSAHRLVRHLLAHFVVMVEEGKAN